MSQVMQLAMDKVDRFFTELRQQELSPIERKEIYHTVGIQAQNESRLVKIVETADDSMVTEDLFDGLSDTESRHEESFTSSPVNKKPLKKKSKPKGRTTTKECKEAERVPYPANWNGETIMSLSVKQMKQILKDKNIKGCSSLKKEALQDRLVHVRL